MAEDIAASDADQTEISNADPAPDVKKPTPAKTRKPRARKTAKLTEDVVKTTEVGTTPDTNHDVTDISIDTDTSSSEIIVPTPKTEPSDDSAVIDITINAIPTEAAVDTTDVESQSATEKPKKPVKKRTPRKTTTSPKKTEPVVAETTEIADATPSVDNIDVVELTETTKRRRKSRSENETNNQQTTSESQATKRRTAASAKTAAPRTRKTIRPAASATADTLSSANTSNTTENTENTGESEQETPKQHTKTTAKSTTKATPKPRTRKPKLSGDKNEAEPTAVALPDPSAPDQQDNRPLIMPTDEAIADNNNETARPSEKAPARQQRKQRSTKKVVEAPAEVIESITPVETPKTPTVAEKTQEPSTASEEALGANRTIIAPSASQPTIIEHIPPRSSKRVTMTILFIVIGIIGLGAGWAIGSVSNDKPKSSNTPTIVTVPGNQTTLTTPSIIGSGTTTPANDGKTEIFTLSGSSARQSAPFDLPSGVVTLHYVTTGGTFAAKLLPESGGDGTSFDCASACDKEQPISGPPGRYYFDVQSSNGDWNIRIAQ